MTWKQRKGMLVACFCAMDGAQIQNGGGEGLLDRMRAAGGIRGHDGKLASRSEMGPQIVLLRRTGSCPMSCPDGGGGDRAAGVALRRLSQPAREPVRGFESRAVQNAAGRRQWPRRIRGRRACSRARAANWRASAGSECVQWVSAGSK